jgi:hypothetical protein
MKTLKPVIKSQQVIVEFAPISTRYWYKGCEAIVKNNQIRLGGAWFPFDKRYLVTFK